MYDLQKRFRKIIHTNFNQMRRNFVNPNYSYMYGNNNIIYNNNSNNSTSKLNEGVRIHRYDTQFYEHLNFAIEINN